MEKRFESKQKSPTIGTPDAKIIFKDGPYIQHEQIRLNDNFRQYIKTIMDSSKVLRIRNQKTPLQKTYEMNAGSQSFYIHFLGANRKI